MWVDFEHVVTVYGGEIVRLEVVDSHVVVGRKEVHGGLGGLHIYVVPWHYLSSNI